LCDLQHKGKGAVEHKQDISGVDLQKLLDPTNIMLKTDTPYGIQRDIWWDIMFHLCRRGQENIMVLSMFIKLSTKLARRMGKSQYLAISFPLVSETVSF